MMPRRSAMATACVRSLALSLLKMLCTCILTVPGAVPSRCPISLFPKPRATKLSTSTSRGVSAISGMHHVDGPNDFRVHHLLQQIAAHTCFESAIDILISVIRSECKKASLRELGADLPDGLHAVLIGQPQIHQRDIRPVLAKEPHRFLGGPCFRNQTHARFVCENGCNSFSNQFVIVNGKNCNHFSTFTKTSLDGLETGAAWLAKPAAQTCKGSSNDTRVPLPGELSIESSAPISSARSCMPSRPKWPN